MRIILLTILLALPFSASAYTHHFVPKAGAIFGDVEGAFITGSYDNAASASRSEVTSMGFSARAGYGISDLMSVYGDLTYVNQRTDSSIGLVGVQNDRTGIQDFRVGIRGATEGEFFELLYSALLSVPGDSSYKENRDSNPSKTTPSEGRIGIVPQAGFQLIFPTVKTGVLVSYTFYPTDGKAEVTSGGLLYTGDRQGGERTIVELFAEGGVTETLLMGGLITYVSTAEGKMQLQSFGTPVVLNTDASKYYVYQVYGSFTVSDNTRLIPAIAYWNFGDKDMKNQQILGGSLALRVVY